mmetsp:Transcript_17286/g.19334  ORF Transcript_17286/g.19334 Transcript_17286/m.19334 type:complete len:287 (-) Transcript_17286:540-1400(-)
MRHNVDLLHLRQGGQADGREGILDEVEESSAERDDPAVCNQPVVDRRHAVLPHTVAQVSPVTLLDEVVRAFQSSFVGRRQIGRAPNQLREYLGYGVENGTGQLACGHRLVLWRVLGQPIFPARGKLPGEAAGNLCSLLWELLAVGAEEIIPLAFTALTICRRLGVRGSHISRHVVLFGRIEAKLGLDALNLRVAERAAVHRLLPLVLGAEPDGELAADKRGTIGDRLGRRDGSLDRRVVGVCVGNGDGVPAVGSEAGRDIFREREPGFPVDGDPVVVIHQDELAQT